MSDLISVIVPIYGVEEYLPKCIESIIRQTYKNLEIILVDDGSCDKSGEICDKYALMDSRVKVIHKKNGGQDSARKAGMKVANGKYIGYVDGDDWIEPDMYEILLADAQKYDVAVVESGVIDNYEDQEKRRLPYYPEGVYKGEAFKKNIEPSFMYTGEFFQSGITPYLWSKLFKKEAVERYQLWDDDIQMVLDDNLVTYGTIANSKSLYVEHRCLYHYKLNNKSTKHSINIERDKIMFFAYEGYKKRLLKDRNDEIIERQVKYYAMYDMLTSIPKVFDDILSDLCLVPYGGIPKSSKVVLYGAGSVGIHLEYYLNSIKDMTIVCWVDRNYSNINDTYHVVAPNRIKNLDFDYVIISVLRESSVKSIMKDLKLMGIDENKIRWIEKRYIDNPDELLKKANCKNI